MPKAALQKTQKLSTKTIDYLQRLRDTHEEGEVATLVKPQYRYPKTYQVYAKVQYQQRNGKPYDFNKRITRATQHARIDITKCPYATLEYLLDNFPRSEVSINKSYLLIPYTPVPQAISRAYQALPIDTIVEYDIMSGGTGIPSSSTNVPIPPTQSTQQPSQSTLPPIDPNLIAAIITAMQMSGLGAQVPPPPPQPQPKTTKMKIKEPEVYDGKSRGGDAERWLLTCENYFMARSSDFPDDVAKVQFTLSYFSGTAQSWGNYILKDLLTTQLKKESHDWDAFKAVFETAFGDPDKEGTAIRKLESLTQGQRPVATYTADFRRITADISAVC
ncbi:hypothetical protein M407DRAFT_31658 [Tulasnella calospora MUT 4182]|uniref:Retrotransposon gag domain-containing protein n=1 Tax=Tulasnella calospora MUT 4182 TaxID=1051891 RepID=A0A0C3LAZ3_9AGAM|nr:hypothetical protein M407DRAFT_31658 [Tulasnella calospora MUT 4182]